MTRGRPAFMFEPAVTAMNLVAGPVGTCLATVAVEDAPFPRRAARLAVLGSPCPCSLNDPARPVCAALALLLRQRQGQPIIKEGNTQTSRLIMVG